MGKQSTHAPVSIRRGSGHGTLVKVLRVIGGSPFRGGSHLRRWGSRRYL